MSQANVQEKQGNPAERFTDLVVREFGTAMSGLPEITEYERALIQGYFIGIDRALSAAESNRYEKYNKLPFAWSNVNLQKLAVDVMNCAHMGLDMRMPNHVHAIPFKNKKLGKYDISLMRGYAGVQYVANKYAVEAPRAVTVELVHANDEFKVVKKSYNNPVESYVFDIPMPFDRGKVIGGFGYIEYPDPQKNVLVLMSLGEILKRRGDKYSAEFWGGKAKRYDEDNKQVTVEVEGWFEEMCMKTLKREVYSGKYIPVDPMKVDETYRQIKLIEDGYYAHQFEQEIEEKANAIEMDANSVFENASQPADEQEVSNPSANEPPSEPDAPQSQPVETDEDDPF